MSLRWLTGTLRWLLVLTLALFVVTFLLWWSGMDPRAPGEQVGELHTALTPWRGWLQLLRIMLWIAAWYGWQGALARALGVTADQRPQWTAMRPVLIGGLLVVEVLIIISRGFGSG